MATPLERHRRDSAHMTALRLAPALRCQPHSYIGKPHQFAVVRLMFASLNERTRQMKNIRAMVKAGGGRDFCLCAENRRAIDFYAGKNIYCLRNADSSGFLFFLHGGRDRTCHPRWAAK